MVHDNFSLQTNPEGKIPSSPQHFKKEFRQTRLLRYKAGSAQLEAQYSGASGRIRRIIPIIDKNHQSMF